jgi:predicted ABC-type ATPase
LIFLWLPSVDTAIARVALRVKEGGHFVPDAIIARRFASGLRNMRHVYLLAADIALIYDNSDGSDVLIAERRPGSRLVVHDQVRWGQIEDATR